MYKITLYVFPTKIRISNVHYTKWYYTKLLGNPKSVRS